MPHPATILAPTQVGGDRRGQGVRSAREPDRTGRARMGIRRADRRPRRRGRPGDRDSAQRRCPADDAVVLHPRGRRDRARAPCAQALLFGAPAAFWLLAAAFSFVDGRLMPDPGRPVPRRDARGVLLGNLRDVVLARVGLAVILGSMATIILNRPGHSPGELVFIPLLFGIAWLAGFALNARAEQADAAEARAHRRSESGRPRRGSPSRRSGQGSRASSTTSSPTP